MGICSQNMLKLDEYRHTFVLQVTQCLQKVQRSYRRNTRHSDFHNVVECVLRDDERGQHKDKEGEDNDDDKMMKKVLMIMERTVMVGTGMTVLIRPESTVTVKTV